MYKKKTKKTKVKANKRTRRTKSKRAGNGTEECAICLEPLNAKENDPLQKVYKTKCNHSYHVLCLHKWCLKNKECPLCKGNITKDCAAIDKKIQNTNYQQIPDELFDKYLKGADFFVNDPPEEEIIEIKEQLKNFKFDKNWVDCYSGEKVPNFEHQIYAKIQCWMKYKGDINDAN